MYNGPSLPSIFLMTLSIASEGTVLILDGVVIVIVCVVVVLNCIIILYSLLIENGRKKFSNRYYQSPLPGIRIGVVRGHHQIHLRETL